MAEVNWSMLGDLGNSFIAGQQAGQKAASDASWNTLADNFMKGAPGAPGGGAPMTLSGGVAGPAVASSTPSMAGGATAMKMPSDPVIEQKFAQTLQASGLTNQYGLAAMMSHVNAESGFSPSNFAGSWSDPSQSGQSGTSGGALSWRDGGGSNRFTMMRNATAGAADPVAAQAKYALLENPNVTMALQNAKSADEANAILAGSQRYAGWNSQGGETAKRLAGTTTYMGRLSSLLGGGVPAGGTQVANAVLPPPRPGDLPTDVADASTPAAGPAGAPARAMPAQSGLTAGLPGNTPTLANPAPAPVAAQPGAPLSNFPLLAGASPIVAGGLNAPKVMAQDVAATGSIGSAPPVAPAAAAVPLDKGVLFRMTNGAKVDPNGPATSYVGASTIVQNRDLFIGPDGKSKTVGQVVASLNPSAAANTATDASPGPAPAPATSPAAIASADGYVPAASGLVPSSTRAFVGAGAPGAPAAAAPAGGTPAAPAKVDMTGDFPVTLRDGTTWTRAKAAATEDEKSPAEEDVEAAQGEARRKAGLDPATGQPISPGQVRVNQQQAAQTVVAQSAASGGPTIPTRVSPGAPLPPPAANPADNGQVRMMIGMMLKDPSTRAAGIQAMMSLQTKANVSPPFMFNGNLMQYGADGVLHSVIQAKDAPDEVRKYQFYTQDQQNRGLPVQSFSDWSDKSKTKTQLVDLQSGGKGILDMDTQKVTPVPGVGTPGAVDLTPPTIKDANGNDVVNPNYAVRKPDGTVAYPAKAGIQMTNDLRQENAEASGTGAARAKVMAGIMEAGPAARDRMRVLDTMAGALDAAGPNMTTGLLGEAALKAKEAVGGALGIQIPGTSATEVFSSMGPQLASTAMREMGGRAQAEFKAFLATKPSLMNSADGNQKLLQLLRDQSQHAAELSDLAADSKDYADFRQKRDAYEAEHPVMNPFTGKPLTSAGTAKAPTMAQGGAGPAMPPPGADAPAENGNGGGGAGSPPPGVAPPGQRVPIPAGYNAARVVSDAQAAVAAHPELKAAIGAKLNAYGIPSSVLGN